MNTEKFDQLVSSDVSVWHTHKDWQEKAFNIALRIVSHMRTNKISQVQLANTMGMKAQSLNRIIQGKENLTLETICRIEKALQISIIEVVFSNNESFEVKSDSTKFTNMESLLTIHQDTISLNSIEYENQVA
jgi:plasmid maintenance system antidote protein VapI